MLDSLAKAGGPPLEAKPPEFWRPIMNARRLPGDPPPIHHQEDRTIPGPGGDIPIRIYRPADGTLPVLVYFHGGGWVLGTIDSGLDSLRILADESQCVIVSVDYRLAPEHRFPAAVEDAYAATQWVAEHAGELDVDPDRLAVGGDSAGGNLAAVVAQLARDRGGPSVKYQILAFPVMDYNFETKSYIDNADGYFVTREGMKWFWGHYLGPDGDGSEPMASPLRAAGLSGLPPAHVITAEYDVLRDEGEAYAERLRAAGVPVTAVRYDGHLHDFWTSIGVYDDAEPTVRDVGRRLAEALKA